MVKRLRLFPDYGAETPVWSERGQVSFAQLNISDALREALIAWQREALDTEHPRAGRGEEGWLADGLVLAERLSEEIGLPVDLDP